MLLLQLSLPSIKYRPLSSRPPFSVPGSICLQLAATAGADGLRPLFHPSGHHPQQRQDHGHSRGTFVLKPDSQAELGPDRAGAAGNSREAGQIRRNGRFWGRPAAALRAERDSLFFQLAPHF